MIHNLRTLGALAAAALLSAACADATPSSSAAPRGEADLALVGGPPSLQRTVSATEPQNFRFRSVEDAEFPPDPAVCAQAPFGVNVRLGASLWSEASNASEGRVVNHDVKRVGSATACVRITNPAFPEGSRHEMYAQFDLPEGRIVAQGGCTITSNDVPRSGLVLAGCHLKVLEAPSWYAGGAVASLSTFNPARLAGFATGSEWLVQLYGAE